MKHDVSVTKVLIFIFLISQLFGLFLITYDAQVDVSSAGRTVGFSDTAVGERPDFEGFGSIVYLSVSIGLATIVLLLLIKMRMGRKIWKAWFALAVGFSIILALGVFLSPWISFLVAILLTYLKLHKSNIFTHNITEILMYAGLGVLMVPLLDVFWASIMLILISIYDAIAVWKSKHMISLANFVTESNLFAGLLVNYKTTKGKTEVLMKREEKEEQKVSSSAKKTTASKKSTPTSRQAILGGGDIVFPLLFTGSIIIWLLELGFTKQYAFGLSLIVTVCTTGALTYLFFTAKKDRFYPAMPFISAGCFLGLIVLLTVLQLL